MATIILTLKNKKRKDNTYSIVIRIRHEGRFFDILTGENVPKNKFDKKKGAVLGNRALQLHLDELKEKYAKRLRAFISENINRPFSLEEIKAFVLRKSADEITVEEFWKENIDQLIKSGRGGSARTYKNTLNVFSKIINLKCSFRAIGLRDLQSVEKELRIRGNKYNSIAVYMRTFRAICNRAIQYNLVDYEWYPFRKYKIKKEKTVPRVLSLEEIKTYFQTKINKDDPLFKAWNVGKLLFMLRGINLRDLLYLTEDNLRAGRIIYKRGKTGKMYSIILSPEIEKCLKLFQNDRKTLMGIMLDEYLENPTKSLHSRAQITKRLNTKLKLLGERMGFQERLTTYVFRYTYANVARKLGYSKDLIAEALGHEYGNSVTGIYLELFDQETLDKMADHILQVVTNQKT
ncbi:MAG: site-specific integrase [Algoriphagus sp.]|uniref:tyrosine-type recombinase/integrase n=1 Tax=Algoriphagus sp. TaxID=1872435 RepID=UPI00181C9416|nr:phage integrase SAM-like domain-containing protein [Algoriphagus sp.]NVJ85792.1 site-specific integrase [Algoriphagus sp.]